MKKHNWLDFAEYASLIGVGVGTVASQLSSQLLYASAPMSLVLILNLINRRRLDLLSDENTAIALQDLDQKLSKHVELLNQQVLNLPTPEMLGSVKKTLLTKNREVLEQLSKEIGQIQDDVQKRLSGFEAQNLDQFRKGLGQLQDQYRQLTDSVTRVNTQIQELSTNERVNDLDRAVAQLKSDTSNLSANLQALAEHTKPNITSIQEQINYLNRQFQKLPPPFDSTALKQEVTELIRVVSDLVPKRDWNNLLAEMKSLQQQQESQIQNEQNLRSRIQDLNQQLQARPLKANLTSLQNQINHLNRQFQKLPPPFDPSSLKQEVASLIKAVSDRVPKRDWSSLVTQLKALQQQQEFQAQVEITLQRELRDIHQQLQAFILETSHETSHGLSNGAVQGAVNGAAQGAAQGAVNGAASGAAAMNAMRNLAAALDVEASSGQSLRQPQQDFQARIEETLQRELKTINQQLQGLPSGAQLQAQVEEMLEQELQEINEQLRAFPADPHYELVFDFKVSQLPQPRDRQTSSRAVLNEALATAQQRLILIWPWSSQCDLDDALLEGLTRLLRRGCRFDLGWCHQAGREDRFLHSINQRWSIPVRHLGLQETLQKLLRLKRHYPDQFQFQILGTTENFLVVDQAFAVLGTDDALTQNTGFSDLELKLRTTDAEVIQQLIHRFDNPVLHPQDVAAYWNRAVTRYDLGDKEGALADLNHVLSLTPADATAYNYRGLVWHDLGKVDEAIADFGRALDLNPQFVYAYCNRGLLLSDKGDQLGAIADYSLAIQYQPDLAIAYFYRGLSCQKLSDPQGALTDFSAAIRLAPDVAPCYYYRGQIRTKLNDRLGAIADFEAAVVLFTQRGNRANADKAMKNLAKLKKAEAVDTLLDSPTSAIAPPPEPVAASAGAPTAFFCPDEPSSPEPPTADSVPPLAADTNHSQDQNQNQNHTQNPQNQNHPAEDAPAPITNFKTLSSFLAEVDDADELRSPNAVEANQAIAPSQNMESFAEEVFAEENWADETEYPEAEEFPFNPELDDESDDQAPAPVQAAAAVASNAANLEAGQVASVPVVQPADMQPAETPADMQPADTQPADMQPAGIEPINEPVAPGAAASVNLSAPPIPEPTMTVSGGMLTPEVTLFDLFDDADPSDEEPTAVLAPPEVAPEVAIAPPAPEDQVAIASHGPENGTENGTATLSNFFLGDDEPIAFPTPAATFTPPPPAAPSEGTATLSNFFFGNDEPIELAPPAPPFTPPPPPAPPEGTATLSNFFLGDELELPAAEAVAANPVVNRPARTPDGTETLSSLFFGSEEDDSLSHPPISIPAVPPAAASQTATSSQPTAKPQSEAIAARNGDSASTGKALTNTETLADFSQRF